MSVTAEQRKWLTPSAPGELWNPRTVPTRSERRLVPWDSSRGAATAYGLRQGHGTKQKLGDADRSKRQAMTGLNTTLHGLHKR